LLVPATGALVDGGGTGDAELAGRLLMTAEDASGLGELVGFVSIAGFGVGC
jgi:hypothetical protein